jgi:hypothetical protein
VLGDRVDEQRSDAASSARRVEAERRRDRLVAALEAVRDLAEEELEGLTA